MSEPKYIAGCKFIREKIESGEWPPGHKLPSQAQWESGEYGLTLKYGTLRGVYIILRTEGWIVGQQGDGVYVAQKPPVTPKPTKTDTRAKTGRTTRK
jgi:GntR family transcriptional regulator